MIMKFVDKIFEKVGVDKVLHFVVGGWITAKFCESGSFIAAVIGILFVCFISIVKERLDSKYDWKDIAAAMLGCLVELVTWYLIMTIC